MASTPKQPLKHKNCLACGKEIDPNRRSHTKYCNPNCYQKYLNYKRFLKKNKKCVVCGDEVPYGRPNGVYCGEVCFSKTTKEKAQMRAKKRNIEKRSEITAKQRIRRALKPFSGPYAKARKLGFRSMFEVKVSGELEELKIDSKYEAIKIPYQIHGNYIPDFYLTDQDIFIECKGYLDAPDRRKMAAVKKCNPGLDIRFVFQNNNQKNIKWAEKHKFPYGIESIPQEWFRKKIH